MIWFIISNSKNKDNDGLYIIAFNLSARGRIKFKLLPVAPFLPPFITSKTSSIPK